VKKKLDGKKVRFIAVDPKYSRTPYPAIAPESGRMGTYVTGQHIDPDDPDTHNNLTKAEMLNPDEIKPAARRSSWLYVINPEAPVMIMHGKWYDCRLNDKGKPINPKDYAEAYFIIEQDIVAENKDASRKDKHKFYLEDKDAEAKLRIEKFDAIYEAEKLVREHMAVDEYRTVIEILNMQSIQFRQPTQGLTELRMKDILLDVARKTPEVINKIMSKESKVYFYIYKLVDNKIIAKQKDGFYEGRTFLSTSFEQMAAYVENKANAEVIEKWNRLLRERELILD